MSSNQTIATTHLRCHVAFKTARHICRIYLKNPSAALLKKVRWKWHCCFSIEESLQDYQYQYTRYLYLAVLGSFERWKMIDASGQGGGWLSDTEQQHWLACGAGPPGGDRDWQAHRRQASHRNTIIQKGGLENNSQINCPLSPQQLQPVLTCSLRVKSVSPELVLKI